MTLGDNDRWSVRIVANRAAKAFPRKFHTGT
jgi:hypothetical protein